MIRAVLFDLDGTLLDRDTSVRLFIQNQYERLKPYLSHIEKEMYVERFIALDDRGYVWKDKVYQQLVEEFSIPYSAGDLLADYLQEFKHHCVPYEHIHSMIQQLKNKRLKLAIITNGYGQFQLDNIKALGIESEFEIILISEWEGIKKPDSVIFHRALTKLGVEASASIYIGDHPVNDVKAANQAGMIGVWKRNEWFEERGTDTGYVVNDLLEILKIIQSIEGEASSSIIR